MCRKAPCQPQSVLASSLRRKSSLLISISNHRWFPHSFGTVSVVEVPEMSQTYQCRVCVHETILWWIKSCCRSATVFPHSNSCFDRYVRFNVNSLNSGNGHNWLSQHSVTRCRPKSSIFSTSSDEAIGDGRYIKWYISSALRDLPCSKWHCL